MEHLWETEESLRRALAERDMPAVARLAERHETLIRTAVHEEAQDRKEALSLRLADRLSLILSEAQQVRENVCEDLRLLDRERKILGRPEGRRARCSFSA